jgi:hypothetical protein
MKTAIVAIAMLLSTPAWAQFNSPRFNPGNPSGAPTANDMLQGMFQYEQQRQWREDIEEQERLRASRRYWRHQERMFELRRRGYDYDDEED